MGHHRWVTGALLWYLLAALIVLDALRGRKKLAALPVVTTPTEEPTDSEYALLRAEGAELADSARSAACAFAHATGADAVALIAPDTPANPAMTVVQITDPEQVRLDRLTRIKIVGSVLLVRREILERAGLKEGSLSTEQLRQAAAKVRRYAEGPFEYAITPGVKAPGGNPFARWQTFKGLFGEAAGIVVLISIAFLALLWTGSWLFPAAGGAALAAFHLQPLLTFAGGPLKPRHLLAVTLLRSPWALWEALLLIADSLDSSERAAQVRALRPVYEKFYADNGERFFEAPREDCPVCSSSNLEARLVTSDLFQNKPGRFRLDRCRDCGHIFQNPRLAPAGLDYYYRDFYDGLGRESAEAFFSLGVKNQKNQVETVLRHCRPARWLDVGGGHGHLCQVAKRALPETRFQALDVSDSIEEAERAGWIEKGHRGFFPAVAPEMEDQFDLVSMFHYLEHTLDQRAELAAAYQAVAPGGHLVIEVPNPESAYSRWLGKYWLPWFQPQHLHLIHRANLERLLREVGFEPVESAPVAGSEKTGLLFAAVMLTHHLGPEPDAPWRRPASALRRLRYYAVQAVSPLLMVLGLLADRMITVVFPAAKLANAYRVTAKSQKR